MAQPVFFGFVVNPPPGPPQDSGYCLGIVEGRGQAIDLVEYISHGSSFSAGPEDRRDVVGQVEGDDQQVVSAGRVIFCCHRHCIPPFFRSAHLDAL